jgi:hypothetical protein
VPDDTPRFAILELGVFLASALAIDALVGIEKPKAQCEIHFRRPVPISLASKVINARSDSVLRKLRNAGKPIDGDQRPTVAELDDIISCYGRAARRLRAWADREFPVAD